MPSSTSRNVCRLILTLSIVSGCGIRVMNAQAGACCLVSVKPGGTTYSGLLISPGTLNYPYNAYETFTVYGCGCGSSTTTTVTATGQAAWGQWCPGGTCAPQNNSSANLCPGVIGATTSTEQSWNVSITPSTVFTAHDKCQSRNCVNPYTATGPCIPGTRFTSVYPAPSCSSSSMNPSNKSNVLAALNSKAESASEGNTGFSIRRYRCSVAAGKSSHPSASTSATKWECSPNASTLPTVSSVGHRNGVLRDLGGTGNFCPACAKGDDAQDMYYANDRH